MRVQTQDKDELESCAADWILRRDRGELAPHQRAELEAWLSADSRHRDAYLKLDELWRASTGLKNWRPIDGDIDLKVLVAEPEEPGADRGTRFLALAASLVLLVAVSWFIWSQNASQLSYTTQIGGYQRVLLEDGSIVQLNTDTQVQKHFTGKTREIRLLRGEAYFDVAHDANRPFRVTAGGKEVRALGTAFTVRLRDRDALQVIVSEGKVVVSSAPASGLRKFSFKESAETPTLAPLNLAAGQAAEAKPEGVQVARLAEGELNRRLAWQGGELRFKKQALAEVVAEFNRYNRRRLEIVDPKLAAVEVGGSFKANDLESFVAAMRGTLGIEAEESAAVIRLK